MSRLKDTVERLRQCDKLLRLLIDDAREMLDEPADAQWLGAVVSKMADNLATRIGLEQWEGYLADVLDRYPSWHPQIVHLQQEHRLLARQLKEIRDRITAEAPGGPASLACRRQLSDWIHAYQARQEREEKLLQEAFVLDAGQGE